MNLARILDDAARGNFPAPDGRITVVPQLGMRDAGVLAFTAHTVIFTDEDPRWVHKQLSELECDLLAAAMNARFLAAFIQRTRRSHDCVDLMTVADALPGEPPLELRPLLDTDHPRVVRARRRRHDVRVWAADGGVLVIGRGIADRWETAIEVDENAREQGLGRLLALAARHLIPAGEHLWSQQAAGNARSMRAFQAAGYRPVGAEALLLL